MAKSLSGNSEGSVWRGFSAAGASAARRDAAGITCSQPPSSIEKSLPSPQPPNSQTGSKARLAILISGRGSNMEALIDAARAPDYPATPVLVVANRADAAGLATAARAGIPAIALPHRDYPGRAAFDAALAELLHAHAIDLIALAGFMRILTPGFIRQWPGRILNIHPSLLPRYPGLDTHARAIAAGDTEAGCTVHLVTDRLDDGPILAQASVPVLPGDTPETLAARVLEQEHRLYPQALARHAASLAPVGSPATAG